MLFHSSLYFIANIFGSFGMEDQALIDIIYYTSKICIYLITSNHLAKI